jgi:predicted ArsR family transcriptional regulator
VISLTERQVAEFWHRSYAVVDGLWFMKVEERSGFDTALDIDDDVWRVLPKIQARMLKSLAQVPDGIDGLYEAVTTKLNLEGFDYEAAKGQDGFEIALSRCPWHDAMVRTKREHPSGKVGTRICNTENSVWASEFGEDIRFELGEQICEGAGRCVLRFSRVAIWR